MRRGAQTGHAKILVILLEPKLNDIAAIKISQRLNRNVLDAVRYYAPFGALERRKDLHG